jgi:hypothetical protein
LLIPELVGVVRLVWRSNETWDKGRLPMIAILHFITLVITTMFAVGAAALVNWLLLRGAFQLMRPATANRKAATGKTLSRAVSIQLVPGTIQVIRAYSGRR